MINRTAEDKTCPDCQHHNAAEKMRCANCNALLPISTKIVTVNERKPSHSLRDMSPLPGKVIIYIPSKQIPIILPTKSRMKVGRVQPDNLPIDIDLSPFSGQGLGVSRIHAALTFTEKGVFIEDMGSSNGTWLNEKRLSNFKPHTLLNGDLVRFGNLVVFIYFSDQQAIKSTFHLKANGTTNQLLGQGINLSYFRDRVFPYLGALAALQLHLNEATGNASAEIRLCNIQMGDAIDELQVSFYGVSDIIQFITTKLALVNDTPNPTAALDQNTEMKVTRWFTKIEPLDEAPAMKPKLMPEKHQIIGQMVNLLLDQSIVHQEKEILYLGLTNALINEASQSAKLALGSLNIPFEVYNQLEPMVNDLFFHSTVDEAEKQHYIEISIPHAFTLVSHG